MTKLDREHLLEKLKTSEFEENHRELIFSYGRLEGISYNTAIENLYFAYCMCESVACWDEWKEYINND